MKVLTARLDSIGDVLLTGPAVRAISEHADRVWMLCGPQGAPAAHVLPGVDRVVTWAAAWISNPPPRITPWDVQGLIDRISAYRPDRAVIFTSFHQSPLPLAMLLRLAGVRHITGVSTDYAGSLLDVRLTPGKDLEENQPEALRAIAIAAAAGFPAPRDDRLQVDLKHFPSGRRGLPGPYVVVHPGADAPARRWPAEHYRGLVTELARRGWRVVVTGSPSETILTSWVAGTSGVDYGGRTSLADLAHILKGAQTLVTGNTGPAHLAAAVGTSVVSLFAPVVPATKWAPWRVPTIILGDQYAPCLNTRARTCPIPGHPCLTGVDPRTVADACEEITRAPSSQQATQVGGGVA